MYTKRPKTTGAVAAPPHERLLKMRIASILMDFHAGPPRAVFTGRRKVKNMKTKLLAMMLLAGGTTMFAQTRFSVGVNVGGVGAGYFQSAPPPNYFVPARPGPDYFFVDGYWAQDRGRRHWVSGFWQRRAFVGRSNRSRFDERFDGRFDNRFRDNDRRNDSRNGFRGR